MKATLYHKLKYRATDMLKTLEDKLSSASLRERKDEDCPYYYLDERLYDYEQRIISSIGVESHFLTNPQMEHDSLIEDQTKYIQACEDLYDLIIIMLAEHEGIVKYHLQDALALIHTMGIPTDN